MAPIPTRVNYYPQQTALKEKFFPAYNNIYSQVQQINLQRLDKTWQCWLPPDQTGQLAGRPRFKKKGELRSFGFSRVNHPKAACFLSASTLQIPSIGEIPLIVHRPIPDGFTLKTATLVKKADGWYTGTSTEDRTVPTPKTVDTI